MSFVIGRRSGRAGRAGHRHPKATNGTRRGRAAAAPGRRSAIKARTQAANQIHSVIDTAPEELRAQLVAQPTAVRIARCSRLRPGELPSPLGAAKLVLASLAKRWSALDSEVEMLANELGRLVTVAAPGLMAVKGVGTDVAGYRSTRA